MTDQQIEFLLAKAYQVATESPDPSTQNGALIVSPGGSILVSECNRFPVGIEVTDELRNNRELKLKLIEHAERNAIYAHARDHSFMSTEGLFMVCPWAACADCARAIVQAGIRRLYVHKQRMEITAERWADEVSIGRAILEDGLVQVVEFDGPVWGAPDILISHQRWNPGNDISRTD